MDGIIKLVKISEKHEYWINPNFVNLIVSLPELPADMKTEISTSFTRVTTELSEEVIKRLDQ